MKNTLSFTFRFLSGKNAGSKYSLFSGIVVSGIALGVTTLIIALTILSGFENVITEKLINLDSHIQITGFSNRYLPDSQKNMNRIKQVLGENLETIQPVLSNVAIAGNGKFKEGVVLQGVALDYLATRNTLTPFAGELKFLSDSADNVVLGRSIAQKLFVKPGEHIFLFIPDKPASGFSPADITVNKFTVSGIFESGMSKYDDNYLYIPYSRAAALLQTSDEVSSYHIRLRSIKDIDSIATELQLQLDYPHYVRTVFQINQALLTWIDLQKKPIPIILGLIILVAAFNIISSLFILILSKVKSIGTLRILGMKRSALVKVFLLKGLQLGMFGIIIGNVTAVLLLLIQMQFNIITLPASVYFISEVPITFLAENFLLPSGLAFGLVMIVSLVPSLVASGIKPVSTLRFE